MKASLTILLLGLAAAVLSGCRAECSVTEATGLFTSFAGGCAASGDFDDGTGVLQVSLDSFGSDKDMYRSIEFAAAPPFYVGKHVSSRVVVTQLGTALLDGDPLSAEGQVDFIIDGADFSKSYERRMFLTITSLEARDLVTSKLGTLRGSLSLLKTGN